MESRPLRAVAAHFHVRHPEFMARLHEAVGSGNALSADMNHGRDDEDGPESHPLITPSSASAAMTDAVREVRPMLPPLPESFEIRLGSSSSSVSLGPPSPPAIPPPLEGSSHMSPLLGGRGSSSDATDGTPSPIEMFDPTANDDELYGMGAYGPLASSASAAINARVAAVQTIAARGSNPRSVPAEVRVGTDVTLEVIIPDFDATHQADMRQAVRGFPPDAVHVYANKVVIEADDPVMRQQALTAVLDVVLQERPVHVFEVTADEADVLGLERRMSSPAGFALSQMLAGRSESFSSLRLFEMPRRKR